VSIENLAQYVHTIEHPRCGGKVEHRLRDILVIAVCAVIACADLAVRAPHRFGTDDLVGGLCQQPSTRPSLRASGG